MKALDRASGPRYAPCSSFTEELFMASPDDFGRLDSKQWDQLEDIASRYKAAWRGSESVDLAAFLPPPDSFLRQLALHELIKIDLHARWQRGEIIGVEAYVDK